MVDTVRNNWNQLIRYFEEAAQYIGRPGSHQSTAQAAYAGRLLEGPL